MTGTIFHNSAPYILSQVFFKVNEYFLKFQKSHNSSALALKDRRRITVLSIGKLKRTENGCPHANVLRLNCYKIPFAAYFHIAPVHKKAGIISRPVVISWRKLLKCNLCTLCLKLCLNFFSLSLSCCFFKYLRSVINQILSFL